MAAKIQSSDIKIERVSLADKPIFQNFSCNNQQLDNFFQEEIISCIKHHYVTGYYVKHNETNNIIAIFTLANDCVSLMYDSDDFIEENIDSFNEDYRFIFKEQSSYPAINIAHLAVDKHYRRRGIGKCIIEYIISTFIDFDIAGCQFITVDSINNSDTNSFYSRMGFYNLSNSDAFSSTRRMYLNLAVYRDI